MFKTILLVVIVISFYGISIWQYRNPTKAIHLWQRSAYIEKPKIDEELVRRSILIRGTFFTILIIVIAIFMYLFTS